LVIQLLYIPLVILGARATLRGGREHRNFLLIVFTFYFLLLAMTTLTALPLLRYLVPTVCLVMIVAAVAFEGLPNPSSCGVCRVKARLQLTGGIGAAQGHILLMTAGNQPVLGWVLLRRLAFTRAFASITGRSRRHGLPAAPNGLAELNPKAVDP
jgi:hypothetical protein